MDREDAIKLLKSGKKGVNEWNAWRARNLAIAPPDLQGANLNNADMRRAFLKNMLLCDADLRGADLRQTNCSGTDFSGSKLGGSHLVEADFGRANFTETDLTAADMRSTDLWAANFDMTILTSTKMANASVGSTHWIDVDLSGVADLASIQHLGPSTISVATLLKSNGRIPESFLIGCGVPQNLVEYLSGLIAGMQPIQFYSCFISHSSKDKDFARRLHGRMQQEKLRVWFDEEDMKAGRKLHDQICEAIRVYDKLLLILSPDSMNSEWVKTEIFHARQKELREKRQVLFPIRLCDFDTIKKWQCVDADTGKDLAREIREYYIPGDFQNWKDHDAFEAAFAKLLQDLRAGTPAP
jgi:hypothetical protein